MGQDLDFLGGILPKPWHGVTKPPQRQPFRAIFDTKMTLGQLYVSVTQIPEQPILYIANRCRVGVQMPLHFHGFFIGLVGWFAVGVFWKDRAIMLIHVIALGSMIIGLLSTA